MYLPFGRAFRICRENPGNVKNGTLVIDYKEKNVKNVKNLIFYITAPDLSKVKIDGVGNFDAKEN